MKNPNGPSREDVEAWKDAQHDRENTREIDCPECGEKVIDKKTGDELTVDHYAACKCGWWRKVVIPRT